MVITPQFTLPGQELSLTAKMPNLDYKVLSNVCRLGENAIAKRYGLKHIHTTDGGYWFKDNGANILAIAHLDWKLPYLHFDILRMRHYTEIYCTTLDDRLGAYMLLEYLPKAGVKFDILLTTNEEKARSTARYFRSTKKYNWMFMFDRMGTGSVTYNYFSVEWNAALRDAGLSPSWGSYSCIKDLEHLGCKGVNVGVGYHNNHELKAYASKVEIMQQVRHFLTFYEEWANVPFPHTYVPPDAFGYKGKKKTKLIWVPGTKGDMNKVNKVREKTGVKAKVRPSEESYLELQKAINSTEEKGYAFKKEFLLSEISLLNIPRETSSKLVASGLELIYEVARKSFVEILNVHPGMTKHEAELIRKALQAVHLDLNTIIAMYNIHFHAISKREEEPHKLSSVERKPMVEIKPMPVTLKPEVKEQLAALQLDQKPIEFYKKEPWIKDGKIAYLIPLIKGDDSKLVSNKKGETQWVYPLPEELVGFKKTSKLQI